MNVRRGFTLIEILIGISLAMLLIGTATTAFVQMRTMASRVEARMALNRRAETLYLQLDQRLSVAQQHCAFVVDGRSADVEGTVKPVLRLLFMRASEDQNNWNWSAQNWDGDCTDLYWELWEYRPDEQRLYQATSPMYWDFRAPNGMIAGLGDLKEQKFRNSPSPRRRLAAPDWIASLEDNQLFPRLPRTAPVSTSLVAVDDRGDWGVLRHELRVACEGVKDLTWEVLSNDGTVRTYNAGMSGAPLVADGVWMDGRSVDSSGRQPGQAGWTWTSTELPARPRLVRLRLTLQRATAADNSTKPGSQLEQTYSFSFQLPATSGN